MLSEVAVIDRRAKPSHGYRAVHVVVNQSNKLIEIQVRTALQQLWAELSEKYSDLIDPSIKYGGGDTGAQEILQATSRLIASEEVFETELNAALSSSGEMSDDLKRRLDAIQEIPEQMKPKLFNLFSRLIEIVPRFKGREQ